MKKKTWYTVAEFAHDRDLLRGTVLQYINRHPELFNGHTKNEGGRAKLHFDDVALKYLDNKYPLRMPVQTDLEREYLEKYAQAEAEIAVVRKELAEARQQIIDFQAQTNALNRQINNQKTQIDHLKNLLSAYRSRPANAKRTRKIRNIIQK